MLICRRRHVFADLQPYICTFEQCEKKLVKFPTREMWAEHEFSEHRVLRSWCCPECTEGFSAVYDLGNHLKSHHSQSVTSAQLPIVLAAAETKTILPIETQDCPLCKVVPGKSQRYFVKHLGRHLEAIALATLPREADEDSELESVASSGEIQSLKRATLLQDSPQPSIDQGIPMSPSHSIYSNESFHDLEIHPFTHLTERPEKCPIMTCEYHQKGFARKYDKNRHVLTHYKGTMVCGFCPHSGKASKKSFNRADVFKRHLVSAHSSDQWLFNSSGSQFSSKKSTSASHKAAGECPVCSIRFSSARGLWDHIDDCILSTFNQENLSETINEWNLSKVSDDADVLETLERHNLTEKLRADSSLDPLRNPVIDAHLQARGLTEKISPNASNLPLSSEKSLENKGKIEVKDVEEPWLVYGYPRGAAEGETDRVKDKLKVTEKELYGHEAGEDVEKPRRSQRLFSQIRRSTQSHSFNSSGRPKIPDNTQPKKLTRLAPITQHATSHRGKTSPADYVISNSKLTVRAEDESPVLIPEPTFPLDSEEDETRCVCGLNDYLGPPSSVGGMKALEKSATHTGNLFIQCDTCHVWQHGGCVGIFDDAVTPDNYFCELCRKDLHVLATDSQG